MDKICENCKFWSDEELVYNGKKIEFFRSCKHQELKGMKVFTYKESKCDIDLFTPKEEADETDQHI